MSSSDPTPQSRSPADQAVLDWLHTFESALASEDIAAAAAMFQEQGFWRDHVAFTWNIHTCEGRTAVADMLAQQLSHVAPRNWQMAESATEADGITEAWLSFETAWGAGQGHLRLVDGQCWTLLTTLSELEGFEEKRGKTRPRGAEYGVTAGGKPSWQEIRESEEARLGDSEAPYCLIVGGGQGGIGLAARLRQLHVPTIVVDKHERAGDAWRKRYKSLCLHDPVWYDHMPLLKFPDHWPVFSPKDKIADWLEMYVEVMEINYWSSTECVGASYDDDSRTWSVQLLQNGVEKVLHPKHLILATGASGFPAVPEFPGSDVFEGIQHHSSQHPGGEGWQGKQCIVVGSNNSAHDICADLWEHGADVTMIQRSSTLIARQETLLEHSLGPLYSEEALENGISTEKADMIFASIPYALLAEFQKPVTQQMAEQDSDFYERLRSAGFLLDFGEDDSGLFMKFLRRGSGYYIDVGASELVADGRIKLASGVTIDRMKSHSVMLTNGQELPADLVIYATGYGPMNQWAAKLISQEVADKVGQCWGLGSDTTKDPGPWVGELRNMWKPTAQPGLWFHGGNLHMSRFYSHFLALQIKARMEGLETLVYAP